MEINYLAVLVCGIVSMVVGFVWYGPLFGKKWAEAIGVNMTDAEECKKMQKAAGPLYMAQFFMTLFQAGVLAYFIKLYSAFMFVSSDLGQTPARTIAVSLQCALSLWIVFIFPIVVGNSM